MIGILLQIDRWFQCRLWIHSFFHLSMDDAKLMFDTFGFSEQNSWVNWSVWFREQEHHVTFSIFIFFSLAGSLLKKDNLDLNIRLGLSVLVFLSFSIIFAFCELGAQLTNQFNALDETLCQIKWYLLPVDVQRMILICMLDAQHEMFLRGYANIVCTRDAFKNVRDFSWHNNKISEIKFIFNLMLFFIFLPIRRSTVDFLISCYFVKLTGEWFLLQNRAIHPLMFDKSLQIFGGRGGEAEENVESLPREHFSSFTGTISPLIVIQFAMMLYMKIIT